ncbi:ABC transporter substrate-binding protein [Actinomadura rugatobispora]|uniref:ABC transporter substrate-binding protein n=1 Tax=Actinomadura rugatobispora TaxID=1994 RepID=A0ABW1A7Y8_9ACTN|nr:ABC transporter substrate-binding protein [Actinomadura rugatobispora]
MKLPASKHRRLTTLLLASVLTTALGACGGDNGAKSDPNSVSVGYLNSVSLAPVFLAESIGCYRQQGLRVKLSAVQPADAVALVAEGKLDVYAGAPSAAVFNQVNSGAKLAVVAGLGTIATPAGEPAPVGVYVRKALVDSGQVTKPADLAGRRIGTIGDVGTAGSYQIARVLAAGGRTLKDVQLVTMSLADTVPALENGSVDAAFLTAPYTAQVEAAGTAKPVIDVKRVYGDDSLAGLVFGPSLLKNHRNTGAAFLKANACAAQRLQGDYRKDAEVVTSLAKGVDAPEQTIRNGALYAFDPKLTVNGETLERMQQIFLGYGGVLTYKSPIAVAKMTDDGLRQAAFGGQ